MRERVAVTGLVFAMSMFLASPQAMGQDETDPEAAGTESTETESADTESAETESAETESAETESAGEEREEGRRRGVRRLGDVVGEGSQEWSMGIPTLDMPTQPIEAQPGVRLPDPDQDAQLQQLLARRAFVPDDPEINRELSELLDQVEDQTRQALEEEDMALAFQLAEVLEALDGEREVVARVLAERDRLEQLDALLTAAQGALESGDLVTPTDASALDHFDQALVLDPESEVAAAGRIAVRDALLERAQEQASELDFESAEESLQAAREIDPEAGELLAEAGAGIETARSEFIDDTTGRVRAAIDEGRYDDADDEITQLVALGATRERVENLRAAVSDARVYGRFEPGQEFRDTLQELDTPGPEMVVIPAGNFQMGSPDNERDRSGNEGPRFRVRFERGFALARTEITVAEYRRFVEDTGYRSDAERAGSSRIYDAETGRIDRQPGINWQHDYLGQPAEDDLPVIHVSWQDANAYVRWLARHTGRSYRLPTEAEFEYALRAGTTTRYWWGDAAPDDPVENVTGDGDRSSTRRSWTAAFRRYEDGFWGPAPVGSLQANPFGLHDMGGNVMEWVEDCWHDSYARAPADGSAWVNPGCERRVLRGGAWSSTPAMSRSAFRIASSDDSTDARVGFRVARDL